MDSLYFLIKSQSFGESPNLFNMNSDFVPASTVSQQREPIPYICSLGARFGYEHMKRVFKPPRLKSQI